MSTRFSLPSAGVAPAAPAYGGLWDQTAEAARLPLAAAPTDTAIVSPTAAYVGETSVTAPWDVLLRQYVSEPIGAQMIGGTFSFVAKALESTGTADMFVQIRIAVVSDDGSTVRGELYAGNTATTLGGAGSANQEMGSGGTRIYNAIALSAVAALNGDRLLVEVGYRSLNVTATSRLGGVERGDPISGTDYLLAADTATGNRPWLEFSQDIADYVPPPPPDPEGRFPFDRLRLEIETAPSGLVNMVPNPSGDLGGWGWVTPIAGTVMSDAELVADGPRWLRYQSPDPAAASHFYTEDMGVTAGQYVAATWLAAAASAGYYRAQIEWLDATHTLLSASGLTAYLQGHDTTRQSIGAVLAPASTAFCRLRFDNYSTNAGANPAADALVYLREVTVAKAATAAELAGLGFITDVPYLNILGATHDLSIVREALNLGTLTATVLDVDLDPSQASTIRPGRKIRVVAKDNTIYQAWRPLFTGEVTAASVTYDLLQRDAQKRARISLTAVDATRRLANTTRSEGVALIDDLPYVLEGCGVPWNVNGFGWQVPSATVVAINENASALDQVAITRDSNLGLAWVNPYGVLNVHDADLWEHVAVTIPEDVYSSFDLGYNTEVLINEVVIKYLRLDPTTSHTEEVVYGPYRNQSSITEWGTRRAEFTVQAAVEDPVAIAALADAVLAANATPVVRVNGIRVPILRLEQFFDTMPGNVYLDLYDEVPVNNDLAGGFFAGQYVTKLTHTISTKSWQMDLEFSPADSVAPPQVTPSPQSGAGGKTLGQLLRPVGEVTMWYGSSASTPDGWLICDGSSFDGDQFPDLEAVLGGTVLPDFTDRFPIGAGTKALGTSGGNPTKTIAAANLPPHAHTVGTRDNSTAGTAGPMSGSVAGTAGTVNTGNGPGTSTPLDVMNPWRAVWVIIRAA